MAKIFYDHLVIIEEVIQELDNYQLTKDDREELIRLIDQNLHHSVLNLILNNLPAEKHEQFLSDFHKTPHDKKLLEYLKKEVSADIDEKIKKEAQRVKKEILAEIKRSQKKH